MGAAISSLTNEEVDADQIDLRGGLTQAALDGLNFGAEHSPTREDSPIGTALRRKKRSRVSVGGAGVENMVKVASETLVDAPMKSPRKSRVRQQENIDGKQTMSPASAKFADKLAATPPRQGQHSTPLSPLQALNDLP